MQSRILYIRIVFHRFINNTLSKDSVYRFMKNDKFKNSFLLSYLKNSRLLRLFCFLVLVCTDEDFKFKNSLRIVFHWFTRFSQIKNYLFKDCFLSVIWYKLFKDSFFIFDSTKLRIIYLTIVLVKSSLKLWFSLFTWVLDGFSISFIRFSFTPREISLNRILFKHFKNNIL